MSDFENRPAGQDGDQGRDRLEELLRRSLETRAQDVRPDPGTWQRVSARVERGRRLRLALAGAGGVAAIALAAVVLPSLLDRGTVELVPPATEAPEVEPTDPPDSGGEAPCGGPEHVAAAFARTGEGLEGTLWAHCDDGSERMLSGGRSDGARDINPAFAPDGSALVFERVDRDGLSTLVYLELATGEQQVLGGGALPAFAPDGRLAWVQPVDGGQDLILIGEPFGEPEMEFPVIDGTDGEWFDARRLAWDATGDTLYAEIGYEESVVYAYEPDSGEGRRVDEPVAEERYGAPSTAPEGLGVAVLARCCLVNDGQAFDRADLRLVDSDDARLLNQMPEDFDADGDVWTAYAPMGELRQVEGTGVSWTGGTRAAWLVGDGDGLWIVEGDGTVHPMGLKVSSGAANPALGSGGPAPRPDGMAPEQDGLAHDAGVTRQRIWQAAKAADVE
ncbi:MAG TPA: hypothetical protein VNU01_11890, partial [Egibacteraceae bacterium]|nr:hypothetical protein [Egibacteraceae bacterium]